MAAVFDAVTMEQLRSLATSHLRRQRWRQHTMTGTQADPITSQPHTFGGGGGGGGSR
ncbi:MAG: hypothetical protein IKR05_08360 [Prevotella sp.]|nr:hypothetical protein [Prevotella sp.]